VSDRTKELRASIARGDLHLYIVKSNTGLTVEVVHLGHLVHDGHETCLKFDMPDPVFVEAYPVGKLVWLATPKRGSTAWDVRPVTTMDARAEAEYAKAKQMLFAKASVQHVKLSDLELSGRNPRSDD
jgi:hypothetical protein